MYFYETICMYLILFLLICMNVLHLLNTVYGSSTVTAETAKDKYLRTKNLLHSVTRRPVSGYKLYRNSCWLSLTSMFLTVNLTWVKLGTKACIDVLHAFGFGPVVLHCSVWFHKMHAFVKLNPIYNSSTMDRAERGWYQHVFLVFTDCQKVVVKILATGDNSFFRAICIVYRLLWKLCNLYLI